MLIMLISKLGLKKEYFIFKIFFVEGRKTNESEAN